ncbi:hypothetical protein [Bradyrhizobium sp. LHD-71]|uniref:hypothetical protein n=1 Tax=Bradyrhizobium sp. LHD-71 TaxID=3072141 RepID=UPI00281066D3|nr:hypothetical protein [Bradyrhizobium sp. LHD-71]MDQ8730149.1 hypothetical protein [Bradyrhizobium sp. LHD-71]
MIGRWTQWKHFPKPERGEHIEAPIGPGIYEVREASTGGVFAFGAADSVAQALVTRTVRPRWRLRFGEKANLANLEYRTCATSTKAEARTIAEGMIGRRETFLRSSP